VALGLAVATLLVVLSVFAATQRICLDRCTGLVDVRGELAADGPASAERVITGLQSAFKHAGTKGVILRINSPGGSPVQAGQIYDEVRRLRTLHPETPVAAVVEEIAASGGYYVAAAADNIYVDKASVVGSIGVIVDGFGFTGAMEKLGVDRRVVTAGENKAFLDPFEPVDPQQRAYIQGMIDEVHEQFITAVKAGRGKRLNEATPGLFSGLVWNGKRAIEVGLADALGTVDSVARDVFKAEEIVDFTPEDNLAERFARRFGATFGRQFATALRQTGWALR
jgi:protease-4